jgi:hypothetical protein
MHAVAGQSGKAHRWLFVPRLPYHAGPRRRFRRTGARSA